MIAELVRNLADWLPVGYAFAAGMLAAFNPCGFLVLPSYVAYYLGTAEEASYRMPWHLRGLRGLSLGLTITLGFVVLFSAAGLAVSLGSRPLLKALPVAQVLIGPVLVGLGLWLLISRKSIGIAVASRMTRPFRRNLRTAFLFGITYAVASLSCTLPVFLAVVGSALAAQGPALAFSQFLSYSLGMGFVVTTVIVGTAFFKGTLLRYLRRVMPYFRDISAIFLLGVGAYLIFKWIRYWIR